MNYLFHFVFLIAIISATCSSAAEKWLLIYKEESANDFMWDKRTVKLIKSTIPSKFSRDLLSGLGGPPDPVYIIDSRYFSTSACVPHACPSKSFFWYDTETGLALGAIINAWDDEIALTLSSREIQPSHIPNAARDALERWFTDIELKPRSAIFFDKIGKQTILDANAFQPKQQFIPPLNGPSFDCSQASTRVESEICKNSNLAWLDLELSQLVHSIHNGHSTIPDRVELIEFQLSWQKNRNSACEYSNTIHDCLIDSYRKQHDALMNWIPAH